MELSCFADQTCFLARIFSKCEPLEQQGLLVFEKTTKMAIASAIPVNQLKRFVLYHLSIFRICLVVFFCSVGTASANRAMADSEAYSGHPFGVGRVTVGVLRGEPVLPLSDERFTVLEAGGRVLYPTLKQEPVRRILRGLLGMEAPRNVTLFYLFQGENPFELSAFTPHEQGIRVNPRHDPAGHRRLLRQWWEQYTAHYQSLLKNRAYPPVAENFLVASLARRLNLPLPQQGSGLFGKSSEQEEAFSSLLVNEHHMLRVDRNLLSEGVSEPLELLPLPEPISWPVSDDQVHEPREIEMESMAAHVPAECFYIRFGSFSNYWWFRELNKKWQGDLGNMLLRRGIKRGAGERIQQQLSLRENALAKILGPQVVADAALIGLDPYLQQGAAIGILLQARNEFLLTADLTKQRRDALAKFEDAKEETLEVDGHKVSLISNPGGQVRSYYASHDGFHLVTTSRTLVELFLQAGQGDGSLANLASFRRAREQYPVARDDTIFAFVSEAFWRNLSSPHYIVENRRRLRSFRESVLLELSRHAARAEGAAAQSTEDLISAGFLPPGFASRAEQSTLLFEEDIPVDSQRGARGYFVPVADMPVADVSAEEADAFASFNQLVQKTGLKFPAVAAVVHRASIGPDEPETISVDLHAQGSLREQLGTLGTWLGQPTAQKLQPVEGDLLSIEAVGEFPTPLAAGEFAEHHVFGGLRDFRAPLVVRRGSVTPDARPAELVRGYLGAWPKPGILALFTGGQTATGVDPQQCGKDLWQAKLEEFLLISFKADVIRQVLPQLNFVPAVRPAQLWIGLQDLTGTQMSENVSALGYMHTRAAASAGSRMMNALANQLHVPRHECRAVAERLVDGALVCPLGGEYQLHEPQRGLETWASSALTESNRFLLTEIPTEYRLPALEWFRGLSGDLRIGEESLSAHLEVHMTKDALP